MAHGVLLTPISATTQPRLSGRFKVLLWEARDRRGFVSAQQVVFTSPLSVTTLIKLWQTSCCLKSRHEPCDSGSVVTTFTVIQKSREIHHLDCKTNINSLNALKNKAQVALWSTNTLNNYTGIQVRGLRSQSEQIFPAVVLQIPGCKCYSARSCF